MDSLTFRTGFSRYKRKAFANILNMDDKYTYSGKTAEVKRAAGISSVLIKKTEGRFVCRVYDEGGTLTDYEIRRDDLSIAIEAGELASLYQIGDRSVLDQGKQKHDETGEC